MPSVCIQKPHYRQEKNYTCVPASARMMLAFHGIERSEPYLARILIIAADYLTTPIISVVCKSAAINKKILMLSQVFIIFYVLLIDKDFH
jgi:hypothetical protein